jgi:hypothetical protein
MTQNNNRFSEVTASLLPDIFASQSFTQVRGFWNKAGLSSGVFIQQQRSADSESPYFLRTLDSVAPLEWRTIVHANSRFYEMRKAAIVLSHSSAVANKLVSGTANSQPSNRTRCEFRRLDPLFEFQEFVAKSNGGALSCLRWKSTLWLKLLRRS